MRNLGSKSTPKLLDLFCGAGGAARGYQNAGFYVVGIDINPMPRYCGDEFHQGDALEYLAEHGHEFDAIHASPPCQGYTTMNQRWSETRECHPLLIENVREMIQCRPYVIENVPGARNDLINPVQLCGSFFGLEVRRHRLFETPILLLVPECDHPDNEIPVYGKMDGRRLWTRTDGSELRAPKNLEVARSAMGIDWMEWDELTQAIPPAYTEFIGKQLMDYIRIESCLK